MTVKAVEVIINSFFLSSIRRKSKLFSYSYLLLFKKRKLSYPVYIPDRMGFIFALKFVFSIIKTSSFFVKCIEDPTQGGLFVIAPT